MAAPFTMKMRVLRLPVLCFGYLLAFSLSSYAGSFRGKVSDLDAGNGYLTVTNPAKQETQTFKVVSETLISDADGKPSQLLNLVEGTLVSIETAPGDGKLAVKIAVLPSLEEPP